ncbi:MAG: Asp-tRNA(Asn)/Glu-tRNA(Gln) amidotransferase subunit GatC [Candidatus Omnitrophica bacterium]|nr:Asp-tRNA(Asn)/Glu-tRNA(Gln) amidotransferase subunit GatC [Candidatus Omnitrophota bacterium]MDD5653843.1 Asp-tRNA(Asn)/Glu-tRNA(Gln) amidotransferase subunit GatC [Candidatus Omnitrophota bacterium]
MSIISKETVQYVAHLSRIELKEKELEVLSVQLEAILDFIDQLKEIDIANIPPTSHILPVNNVLREDSPKPSLPTEKVLANSPEKEGNSFVVPKVIE